MNDTRTTDSLRSDVEELTRRLEEISRELEPGDRRRLRPPTIRELRRFTADVTIPAILLVLETNVRALRLLQRTIAVPDREETDSREPRSVLGERATDATVAALRRLDDALADLQDSLEGRGGDPEFRNMVAEARALQTDIERRLAESGGSRSEPVTIDVEAELDSIKEELGDEDPPGTE